MSAKDDAKKAILDALKEDGLKDREFVPFPNVVKRAGLERVNNRTVADALFDLLQENHLGLIKIDRIEI